MGDKVLRHIAELIRQNLRHMDIPCRFGGDEFVMLLPGENIYSAAVIAKRLRERIENYKFQFEETPAFKMTASIGISCCPFHITIVDKLVKMADEALLYG